MKYLKYKIGNFVIVSKIQIRARPGNRVVWQPSLPYVKTPTRLGQVVGICTRFDGFVNYVSDWHYFVPSKSHRFWLVRFGLINKAVEVAEENMRLAPAEETHELPYRWPVQKMSECDKQNLRDDSKSWPRDGRGRWVAGSAVHRN